MPNEMLEMVCQMLRARPVDPEATFADLRRDLEELVTMNPTPADARCEPIVAAGVPCEWIVANGVEGSGTLLYLHGGGYTIGSINSHRALVARLSAATRLRGLAVDYRLAPEHPFPAAVDDATAAYRWLLGQGVSPDRIVIGGDSAGGGLTVATLVALRDAGAPLPAAGVCLSPWVDLEGAGDSMTTHAALDPMVQRDGLLRMAAAYLGDTHARTPLASPLHADLRGLPPLLIHVGTRETLLDDAVRLAAAAKAADVEVDLEPWDEMIHVWHAFAPLLPEADQAVARVGEWVRTKV
jgi:monoterpene epsilon-lactone hydrolase